MSEKKQVIHVNDLVIKADNVIIEQPQSHRRDPFFGNRRINNEREEVREHQEQGESKEHHENEEREERRLFPWF